MYIKDKNRYLVEHYAMPNAVYANGLALPFQLMVNPGKTMIGIYGAVSEDTNGIINVDERDFSETYKVFEREEDMQSAAQAIMLYLLKLTGIKRA